MGNFNSSNKVNKKIAFVQTVEHTTDNPYSKTNTVSLLDLHEWSSCTKELEKRGYKVIRFTGDEMNNLEFRKSLKDLSIHSPVIANRPALTACLRHLSILSEQESLPECKDYPISLRPFLRRRVKETSFEEVMSLYESVPNFKAFIKPRGAENTKLWTGCVINSKDDFWKLTNVQENTPVYVSEPIEFLSEYRCYVIRGSVKAISCYMGDKKLAPLDLKTVYTAVRCLEGKNRKLNGVVTDVTREASRAYAIDFGVVNYVDPETDDESQHTVLVEMNDGYSLGLYPGCSSRIYTEVLLERWNELVGLKVSPVNSYKRSSCAGEYDTDNGHRSCQGEYK
jgi:hypothetical protein